MSDDPTNVREKLEADALRNGSAWAALVGAGVGCAGFGIVTDVSECWGKAGKLLQWYGPAGSLSGVAGCAILIWVGIWLGLYLKWRGRRMGNERGLMWVTVGLVVVGVVGTFPGFYGLFG